MKSKNLVLRESHWNNFYSSEMNTILPRMPSQFAAFALSEIAECTGIVEFGCGNGRDAHFFGQYGYKVLAFDSSESAIELAQGIHSNKNVIFNNSQINDTRDKLREFLAHNGTVAIYGRFFLHAITLEERTKLFDMLQEILPVGSKVAFEYRTIQDADIPKSFGQHFRVYLNHQEVLDSLASRGFKIEYAIEGQGYAKYQGEDAIVGRLIAKKN